MANRPASSPLSLTVLIDKVALPDNMGALLRVAAGVGARRVVTVRGCSDPWSPKAVRAAMGAHFRIPIESDVPWDLISSRIPRHSQVGQWGLISLMKYQAKIQFISGYPR